MNLQESIRRIIKEVRVPRSERVELYKDDNIIVVVPLTHRALQKYAHQCQWCINDDIGEWEDYHKGKHAVIIQRNPKKPKIGITGNPTASEIFLLAKWDNNQSSFEDVCQMLDYEFRNDRTMSDYYVTISNDINNFATNIVYYSPETGIYDQEDNFLWNFNIEINDIPNVKPKVIEIMDDYLQENEEMNLQENIRRILREEKDRTKLIKKIIDYSNIFEYKHFCGVDIINPEERTDQYNFLDKNNVPFLIKVYFIGGPNSKVWPRTQGVQNKELDLMDGLHSHIISFFPSNIEMMASHVNTCDGYDKLMKRKYSTDELQESIRRVLREEDYSPAGKEVTPNNIVIHKSNPMFRDKIMENGLKVRAGECYKIYVGYGTKCKPAIFATNSTNKRAWFDSTYDDDIWEINTEMIPDVKWYKDRHFESIKKHIVTFQNIPSEALTLKYEGSGRNDFLEESIRRTLKEETSPEKRLKDFVSSNGFTVAKRVFGDNDKFYESLGLKGTQDDMIFIVNTILKHDIEEDICDFFIVKTLHSIKLYVEVPKDNPDKGIDEWANKYDRTLLESKISQKIFSLGNGLVRGHNIKVLPGRC